MEEGIEEKVRRFQRTRSIALACEVMDMLYKILEEEEENEG